MLDDWNWLTPQKPQSAKQDARTAETTKQAGMSRSIDEAVAKALEGGAPVTVNDIAERLTRRLQSQIRSRLHQLRVRGLVIREGRGGPDREFTYRLRQPAGKGDAARLWPEVLAAAETGT
jgi:hypothetical protein